MEIIQEYKQYKWWTNYYQILETKNNINKGFLFSSVSRKKDRQIERYKIRQTNNQIEKKNSIKHGLFILRLSRSTVIIVRPPFIKYRFSLLSIGQREIAYRIIILLSLIKIQNNKRFLFGIQLVFICQLGRIQIDNFLIKLIQKTF